MMDDKNVFSESELTGEKLAKVGSDFGLLRFHNESEESYRQRLLDRIGCKKETKPVIKKPFFYFIVWIVTLPMDIYVFALVATMRLFFGKRIFWQNGLWCELKPSWWTKKYNGAALGHGGIFSPGKSGGKGIDTTTEVHEHVHVEQFEVSMMISFIISIFCFFSLRLIHGSFDFIFSLIVWCSGYILFLVSGWLVALLRGENAYYGSQHEESAYAIAEKYERMKRGF